MSPNEKFLNRFTRQVTEEEAPHLFAALKDLQQKANHPDAVFHRVHFITDQASIDNEMLDNIAGYLRHEDENILVLGKGIRELFGHHTPSSPVSDELKSVIGHELGHVKHGDLRPLGSLNMAMISPLGCTLAAVGGIALARHLMRKHPDDKEKQKELLEEHPKETAGTNGTVQAITTAGLYIAGAALGLWSGIHVKRLHGIPRRPLCSGTDG